MAAHYKIGEFAELGGVSPKTLRFYDEIGLLRPAVIDPRTRYRGYQPRQLRELAAILALKDLGVPLTDIRKTVGKQGSKQERRQLLEKLKAAMELSINEATLTLGYIDVALEELSGARNPVAVFVKRHQGVRVASVRSRVASYAEMVPLERELLSALPADAIGGLRGVLWHRCADSGSLEGEAFVELKAVVPRRSVYDVKELAPVAAACAYSSADDEDAEQAYAAIKRWMSARRHRLAGAKREIYRDDVLEIQFPLQMM